MQKTRLLLASALLAILAAGCNTESSIGEKKGPELAFTTSSEFQDGEQVGIFIDRPMLLRNVKATYNAGKLQTDSKLYWPQEMPKDSAISMRAASPYTTDFDPAGIVPFSVQPDQSSDEDFKASDLRIARCEASPADKSIDFNFEHRLAKFVIYLKSESEIEEVTLSGLMPSVYLNFQSDLFRPTGDVLDIKGHLSAKDENGVCAYEFIVIPQSATLKLSAKAGTHSCTVVSPAAITFEEGSQYAHERLIDLDTDRRSPYSLEMLEEEWDEPAFSYEDPLPAGIELTEATLPGLYTYANGMVSEYIVGGTPQWQTAVAAASKSLSFRVMNPSEGKAVIVTIGSSSISEGKQYSATVQICTPEGIAEISSNVKVEKKVGKTAWLSDEAAGLGFVINTNK